MVCAPIEAKHFARLASQAHTNPYLMQPICSLLLVIGLIGFRFAISFADAFIRSDRLTFVRLQSLTIAANVSCSTRTPTHTHNPTPQCSGANSQPCTYSAFNWFAGARRNARFGGAPSHCLVFASKLSCSGWACRLEACRVSAAYVSWVISIWL